MSTPAFAAFIMIISKHVAAAALALMNIADEDIGTRVLAKQATVSTAARLTT